MYANEQHQCGFRLRQYGHANLYSLSIFIKLIQIPEFIISQMNHGAMEPMLIHLNKLLLATAKAIVNVGPDMPRYTS